MVEQVTFEDLHTILKTEAPTEGWSEIVYHVPPTEKLSLADWEEFFNLPDKLVTRNHYPVQDDFRYIVSTGEPPAHEDVDYAVDISQPNYGATVTPRILINLK